MAKESSTLVDRAAYYRQLAVTVRAHIPAMDSARAREELSALASDYESLAQQARESKAD